MITYHIECAVLYSEKILQEHISRFCSKVEDFFSILFKISLVLIKGEDFAM